MADKAERSAVISGIGASRIGRRISADGLALTVEAVLAAVADAGLELADIDGISTYPGHQTSTPGYSPVGVTARADAARVTLAELDTAEAADDTDRVTIAAMRERLGIAPPRSD